MTDHGDDPVEGDLPLSGRDTEHLPGHWLLARLGKRVLRPGGRELTARMLDDAMIEGSDVLELAPGLGRTAVMILGRSPRSYRGIEADENAAAMAHRAVGTGGTVLQGDASDTGVADSSVDVVVGEAMLTMQTERHKNEIVAEAFRVLRPGGRYAVHELAIEPDSLTDEQKREIRQSLARSIKVNARPLTEEEWQKLLVDNGFETVSVGFAPMALLQPRRVIADEGLAGGLRFVRNVLGDGAARKRVLGMRRTFRKYRGNLRAIELIARKPGP